MQKNEESYKEFFKGKRITLMGLGLLGRGVGDAAFLAECGAELIVTDLKTSDELAPSLKKLTKYTNIVFHLGGHRLEDFSAKGGQAEPDFILKAAGVPLDSPFIAEARANRVPIEMDASLFARLMPKGIIIVGVTGTRGKTTTTTLLFEILMRAVTAKNPKNVKHPVFNIQGKIFLGGNIKDSSTLPLLAKVRPGDVVVLELDSWQLQGFGESKISPHIAVFTTFLPDHMNYYKGDMERYWADKENIFKFQGARDVLIVGKDVYRCYPETKFPSVGKITVADGDDIPREWKSKLIGEHNRQNIACAVRAAEALGVSQKVIREAVEHFEGVSGRLQFLREYKGIKIYNDNNATTPDATIVALRALGLGNGGLGNGVSKSHLETPFPSAGQSSGVNQNRKRIVLIMGGTDKGLDMSGLIDKIPIYCKGVVLLKESGTARIRSAFNNPTFKNVIVKECERLNVCVAEALKITTSGDILLFSPAFASFGRWFKNEYDRGEQFMKIVKKLA